MVRIPLPVLYLAEDRDGKMVAVDGSQQPGTFKRFKDTELKLRLPQRSALDGKTFDILEPRMQTRFEDYNLFLFTISTKLLERVQLDIFERVYSGKHLARQQM